MADIPEFMDKHVPVHAGPDFDSLASGMYVGQVRDLIGGWRVESTFLAVSLWQILIRTAKFATIHSELRGGPDFRVVMHRPNPLEEVDLLMLDSSFTGSPTNFRVHPAESELLQAYVDWQRESEENLIGLVSAHRLTAREYARCRALLRVIDSDFAIRAVQKSEYYCVFAQRPPFEYTSIPATPWKITSTARAGSAVSAGAAVRSTLNSSQTGVTIPAHFLLPRGPGNPVGMVVDIDGHPGVVVSCDSISDSCFVELPQVGSASHPTKLTNGLLPNGLVPALGTTGYFEGQATPGRQTGQITSVNVSFFFQNHLVQQRFDLNCLTNRGDSGCALLDGSDHILGFALGRTAPAANPSFSTWIWANSVFGFHNLAAL